jgi:putative nucleotidyltransferase with HDIG domain
MDASAQNPAPKAHQAEDRIEFLSRVSAIVVGSGPLRGQMLEIAQQVRDEFAVDACVLREVRPDGLHLLAASGFDEAALIPVMNPSGGIASRLISERAPMMLTDVPGDPLTAGLHATAGTVQFSVYGGAPMLVHDEIIGLLGIYSVDPDRRFSNEDLDHLRLVANHVGTAVLGARLYHDLSDAYDRTLEGWSTALEFRDSDTSGHTLRVAELTEQLSRAIGLSEADIVQIRRGALLHDIGKMAIPDSILRKAGALTNEERAEMMLHTERALEMLEPISFLRPALDIPYCHHERWDGSGYPRGLKGEQIPLPARIFAVVDVWDAMCNDRPYRSALPESEARDYLRGMAGVLFDKEIVERFLQIV